MLGFAAGGARRAAGRGRWGVCGIGAELIMPEVPPPSPPPVTRGGTTKDAKCANEIDGSAFKVDRLMVQILTGAIELPVWVKIGRARHLVTEENNRDVCRGMLIALEIQQFRNG